MRDPADGRTGPCYHDRWGGVRRGALHLEVPVPVPPPMTRKERRILLDFADQVEGAYVLRGRKHVAWWAISKALRFSVLLGHPELYPLYYELLAGQSGAPPARSP